jgi:hypothetical protein
VGDEEEEEGPHSWSQKRRPRRASGPLIRARNRVETETTRCGGPVRGMRGLGASGGWDEGQVEGLPERS